jgi:hypothetical protein
MLLRQCKPAEFLPEMRKPATDIHNMVLSRLFDSFSLQFLRPLRLPEASAYISVLIALDQLSIEVDNLPIRLFINSF